MKKTTIITTVSLALFLGIFFIWIISNDKRLDKFEEPTYKVLDVEPSKDDDYKLEYKDSYPEGKSGTVYFDSNGEDLTEEQKAYFNSFSEYINN